MDLATLLAKIAEYRKAVAAFVAPIIPLVVLALEDGAITGSEWVTIGAAALGISTLVGVLPNRGATATSQSIAVALPSADEVPGEALDADSVGR